MQYAISSHQAVGSRSEQEDSMAVLQTGQSVFAVVADGMGGYSHGRAAADSTTRKLTELYEARQRNEETSEGAPEGPPEEPATFFLRALDVIDESVVALASEQNAGQMGTTVVAVLIEKDLLHWFSVGDSRLYLIRGQEMVQATRDHNFALSLDQFRADELPALGIEAQAGSRRDALISYIGIGGVSIYDINEVPFVLQAGDILLLTTDGLYKSLAEDRIREILTTATPEKSLEALFAEVDLSAPAAQDNTSCVLVRCLETGGLA